MLQFVVQDKDINVPIHVSIRSVDGKLSCHNPSCSDHKLECKHVRWIDNTVWYQKDRRKGEDNGENHKVYLAY